MLRRPAWLKVSGLGTVVARVSSWRSNAWDTELRITQDPGLGIAICLGENRDNDPAQRASSIAAGAGAAAAAAGSGTSTNYSGTLLASDTQTSLVKVPRTSSWRTWKVSVSICSSVSPLNL